MAGSGTSKKLAKRNAAAKMLARIHDVPVDLRTPNEADPEDDTFTMVSTRGGGGGRRGAGLVALLSTNAACKRSYKNLIEISIWLIGEGIAA